MAVEPVDTSYNVCVSANQYGSHCGDISTN